MVDMALSIKHPEADRLARELAQSTGEGITEAVINALRERLARLKVRRRHGRPLTEELRAIGERVAALPVLDSRSPDEILDYDERGLPR
jgi:antitoxin VapB